MIGKGSRNTIALHSRRVAAAKTTVLFPDYVHLLFTWSPNHDLCRASLGVNVSYTSNETGMTYPWSVTITDEAGIPIVPEMNGQVQIPQLPPGLPSVAVNRLPLAMQIGLAVPRPSKYTITVRFGDSTMNTDFNAIFVRAAPAATPPDMPEPNADEPRN